MKVSKEMRYAMIRKAANKINKKKKMKIAQYNLLKECDRIMKMEKL